MTGKDEAGYLKHILCAGASLAANAASPFGRNEPTIVERKAQPYVGHYRRQLIAVNAALQEWAGETNSVGMREPGRAIKWGDRLESYLTDPGKEPNPGR